MGGEIPPGQDSGALLRLRAPGDQCLDGTTIVSDGFYKGFYPAGRMVGMGKSLVSDGTEIGDSGLIDGP